MMKTKKRRAMAPIVLSTWPAEGRRANAAAWSILEQGGRHAIDSVEQGVRAVEATKNCCVGLEGIPDNSGRTTLDASIMDDQFRCGSVAFLERIKHPVSVARRVMETSPHVLLVGEGAQRFALDQGFPLEPARTAPKSHGKHPAHDTIGVIAMDAAGHMAAACSTSGLPAKMRGRVGDTAVIGSGLYVDPEVGCVVATGNGEDIIRIAGASTVIEAMRRGQSPEQACRTAVAKLIRAQPHRDFVKEDVIVAFIAISRTGQWGGYSLRPGFDFAVRTPSLNTRVRCKYLIK